MISVESNHKSVGLSNKQERYPRALRKGSTLNTMIPSEYKSHLRQQIVFKINLCHDVCHIFNMLRVYTFAVMFMK